MDGRRAVESRAVRVVAAAMAAAARDFVGVESAQAALANVPQPEADAPPAGRACRPRTTGRPATAVQLGPRRLDLPPPLS